MNRNTRIQCRDRAVQEVSALKRWAVLSKYEVLAEFDRDEVQEGSGLKGVSKPSSLAHLFRDASDAVRSPPEGARPQTVASVAARNALLKATEGVRDEKNFLTFTPESEQNLVAELEFMKVLHEQDKWDSSQKAYITGFLPVGGLVRFKASKEVLFVMKTYHCAALCWPAEEARPTVWRQARNCQSVVWKVIFSADEVEVLPVTWQSPLRQRTEASVAALSKFKEPQRRPGPDLGESGKGGPRGASRGGVHY